MNNEERYVIRYKLYEIVYNEEYYIIHYKLYEIMYNDNKTLHVTV